MITIEKINEDGRGSLHKIMVDNREYILVETFAGKLRGGDSHQSTQHDRVILGTIFWRRPDINFTLNAGAITSTPPGIPHMMTSLTNSLVLEWLDYPELEYKDGEFIKNYYYPYRSLVEAQ